MSAKRVAQIRNLRYEARKPGAATRYGQKTPPTQHSTLDTPSPTLRRMVLEFTKLNGAGNGYVLMDKRQIRLAREQIAGSRVPSIAGIYGSAR